MKKYRIILKFLGIWKVYSCPLNATSEQTVKGSKFDREYSYKMKLRIKKGLRWLFTTEYIEEK